MVLIFSITDLIVCVLWGTTYYRVPPVYPTRHYHCCKAIFAIYCVYYCSVFISSMNELKELFKNNIVIFGIVISLAWVVSSFVLARGLSTINSHDAISVTGTAERMVISDTAK